MFRTVKARNLFSKGHVYNLVRVNDSSVEVPLVPSVLVVKELVELFLDDLLKVHPDKEIDLVYTFFHVLVLSLFRYLGWP